MLAAPLPAPANATIGREGELAEIGALLVRPEVRLLTLVGAGGVGKTRLALEAGRALAGRFPGGAAYVDLAGVEGGSCPRAAAALGVVAETPAELGERLARATRGARALLVLDGFERFLADAAQVAAAARRRAQPDRAGHEPRAAAADRRARLPRAAARGLQRRRAVHARASPRRGRTGRRDDDAVVAEICARLDGLPLAIELAADRARLLPLPALLERLERRLELLSCGPRDLPERQRSLRATLEWSWEVLDDRRSARCSRSSACSRAARSLEACHAVCDATARRPRCCWRRSWTTRRWSSSRRARTRSRGSRCSTPCASSPPSRPSDLAGARARATRVLPRLRRARGDRGGARGPARVARPARPRARQPAGRVRAPAARRARPRTRCGSRSPSRARCRGTRTRTRCAAGSRRRWRTSTRSRAARRAAALYWDGQLALAQARFAEAEAPLEQALDGRAGPRRRRARGAALAALGRRAVLIDSPARAALCEAAVALARGARRSGAARRRAARARGRVRARRGLGARGRMADEALALYREAGDPYGVATALGEQGFYDIVHGRLERAEQRLERGAGAAPPARRRPPARGAADRQRVAGPRARRAARPRGAASSTASRSRATSATSSTSPRRSPGSPPRRRRTASTSKPRGWPARPPRSTSASARRRGSR